MRSAPRMILLFSHFWRNLRRYPFLLGCLSFMPAGFAPLYAEPTPVDPPGLHVQNGVLTRNGKPYCGIGANYLLLFARLVTNKDDVSTLDNLAHLAKAGIPFVRFRANGHRAIGYELYLKDPPEFFRRMDQVVRCAERNGIGLIPSLFWHLGAVPQIVGEPADQLGNPNSKTNAFLRNFTQEMVSRYKDSPAIWGWEFGNEANLATDLPGKVTDEATGITRQRAFGSAQPAADSLSSQDLRVAYLTFAKTVRTLDPWRIIDTGNSAPRRSAWHNARGQFWRADTAPQLTNVLVQQNPNPFDVLSVHIYQKAQSLAPFGLETVSHFIGRYAAMATLIRKPLFIGEFPTSDRAQTEEFLNAIVTNRVPLSAFWVFDYPQQDQMENVDFQNQRSFVPELVARANRALQLQNNPTTR